MKKFLKEIVLRLDKMGADRRTLADDDTPVLKREFYVSRKENGDEFYKLFKSISLDYTVGDGIIIVEFILDKYKEDASVELEMVLFRELRDKFNRLV
ncbi:MAG: hypothetical protein Hyperionvirus31_10 [Hyperionvirus sp.]|uniref:Uncharacterized protein n=1 Tax=Hyperionvirus sp. TaxID=2487770 RepID=A0A3G5ABQ3_9VIRU|nr:MAG: hypothetical protein Hyperionvirus31_10 [Hyperionvirus sp.]